MFKEIEVSTILFTDLELQTHCERKDEKQDKQGMSGSWISATDHMHAGRIGGLILWKDPIVEETRKIRDEIAARFKYDVQQLGQFYISRQKAEGQRVVRRPAKKEIEETENVA